MFFFSHIYLCCVKTLKQHLKLNNEQYKLIKSYCLHSNSLYNCGLYIIKQHYKETTKYIGFNQLYHEMKNNVHYQELPSFVAQQIFRLCDKNYRAFFSLLRRKNTGKYIGPINEPHFRKPNSEFVLVFDNTRVKVRKNELKLTKNLKFKFTHDLKGTIKQTIIKPRGGKYYEISIQYEPNESTPLPQKDNHRYLSIDLGLNNLAACFSNVGPSFLIAGRPLKAYNQFYNKRAANLRSQLQTKNGKKWSNRMSRINVCRDNFIDTYFNQCVAHIRKYCLKHKISKVICGYNESWKQNIDMGKVNNQKFCAVPHFLFKQKLQNKLAECGIETELHEESHTSKCSFLDKEKIEHHDEYMGKRIKRGLFKSKDGKLINADINGAANIMRKVVPDAAVYRGRGIERFIVNPSVFNPLTRIEPEKQIL